MPSYILNTCPRCSGDLEIQEEANHCVQCGREYDPELKAVAYIGINEYSEQAKLTPGYKAKVAKWIAKHSTAIEDINKGRSNIDIAKDYGYNGPEAIRHIKSRMKTLGICIL